MHARTCFSLTLSVQGRECVGGWIFSAAPASLLPNSSPLRLLRDLLPTRKEAVPTSVSYLRIVLTYLRARYVRTNNYMTMRPGMGGGLRKELKNNEMLAPAQPSSSAQPVSPPRADAREHNTT